MTKTHADAPAGTAEVRSPVDGGVVGTVKVSGTVAVERALTRGEQAAARQRRTPAYERAALLNRAAALMDERQSDLAITISSENGKSISEARGEASRMGDITRLAAFEGSQLYGDTLPVDANPGTGRDKIGFTLPQPVGLVVAITPFNYPALLVIHKIAPALAAGNAVILKPAGATPLSALALAQAFWDAGLDPDALQVVVGSGATIGDQLIGDRRVRKISFTGSTAIGEHITQIAGIKRLSLELGASCPAIVTAHADIEAAAHAVSLGGYINAGEVCISTQRVIVDRSVHADFIDALLPKVRALKWGDPMSDETAIGSLISEGEARRVEQRLVDAVSEEGAVRLTGGTRDGAFVEPAVIDQVGVDSRLSTQELFGPAVAVVPVDGFDEAIAAANATDYGLGAGIFTQHLGEANRFLRDVDAGSLHVNWTALWRADLMPYGGLKQSGFGKEGVRSTVREMTEFKTAVLHGGEL